jgi:hypothetical protein
VKLTSGDVDALARASPPLPLAMLVMRLCTLHWKCIDRANLKRLSCRLQRRRVLLCAHEPAYWPRFGFSASASDSDLFLTSR